MSGTTWVGMLAPAMTGTDPVRIWRTDVPVVKDVDKRVGADERFGAAVVGVVEDLEGVGVVDKELDVVGAVVEGPGFDGEVSVDDGPVVDWPVIDC